MQELESISKVFSINAKEIVSIVEWMSKIEVEKYDFNALKNKENLDKLGM